MCSVKSASRCSIWFGSVHALPAAGEAEPWYGDLGGAYTYTFRSAKDGGCEVTVSNGARGGKFYPPEPFPSLQLLAPEPAEFVGTDNPLNVPAYHLDTPLRKSAASSDRQVWYDYEDQAAARQMLFRLGPKYLAKLAAWMHWGQPLSAYAFTFNLLSVGTAIVVRDLASQETIDVTEDVDW